MEHRILETLKTVLIVLLLLTLVAMSVTLISELVTGRSISHWLGEALGWVTPELTYTQTGGVYPAAATPLAISMTGENGRGSTVGDPERTAEQYENLSRHLGEALATATVPVALEQQHWLSLLRGESVSFLFPGEIPLEPLAYWLGAEPAESLAGFASSHLTLCIDGKRVSLLLPLRDDWLCLGTALPPDDLRQALESCRPDGSVFAMEDGTDVAPLSLLTVSTVMRCADSENPLTDGDHIDAAATLMGLNPYRDTAYTADNGAISFSAVTGRLRVTASGVLTYQSAADESEADGSDTAVIDAARQLLAQLSDGLTGDAALQLTGLERSGQTVTVRFDYVLGGYAVRQTGGSAAELTYERGVLRELTWTARCYRFTGETEQLLPARQAAAIVSEGTRLEPVYMDSGSRLVCGWPA